MSVKAGLGIGRFPFQHLDNYWRWIELCEHSKLDSIWHSDRVVSNSAFMEPISVMATLAGATKRIKFGMNSVVLSFRDPVMLAKQCATIDYLSNGRLLPTFGIGGGAVPEWEAVGYEPRQRGKRANEALEVMTKLWSEDQVSYQGEFFQLKNASINPKPVQKNFPIWIGGASKAAQRRTARFGTGWLGGLQSPDSVGNTIAGIKAELLQESRTIDDDHYGATMAFRFETPKNGAGYEVPDGLRDLSAIGSAEDINALISRYRAVGASKFVAIPLAKDDADMLEQSRRFIDEVLPLL